MKIIKQTIELTEFEWTVLRSATSEFLGILQRESRGHLDRIDKQAARHGCRLYAQALARAKEQMPKADPIKKP